MSKRRAVITGIGLLSPLGPDLKSSWQGALAGKSGVGLIDSTSAEKKENDLIVSLSAPWLRLQKLGRAPV